MNEGLVDPISVLKQRLLEAIHAALPGVECADPQVTAARSGAGGGGGAGGSGGGGGGGGGGGADFQCNAAMSLGKKVGRPPREVALEIVRRAKLDDVAEPLSEASVAGPGFINIRLRGDALSRTLERMRSDRSGAASGADGLGVTPAAVPQTVVVDLMGVNLAKQVQVWHLRSTVIGDSLARVLTRLGHRVIRQNHVGDWGLQIAMVTLALRERFDREEASPDRVTLDELDALYKRAQMECEADEKGLAAAVEKRKGPKAVAELDAQVGGARERMADAKRALVALQSGSDPATTRTWEVISRVTMDGCLGVCARLGADVTAEHSAGESSYRDELAGLVDDLVKRGVAEEDAGALVVRTEEVAEPLLIRKSDGGFLYATTDLAGVRRRVRVLGASRVIYVVDARQGLHFSQVFAAAKKAGYATIPDSRAGVGGDGRPGSVAALEHAAFGTMLGENGRPFKTRKGESLKLADLIDEAERRAAAVLAPNGGEGASGPGTGLSESERQEVARRVAVAAIKYADLSSERTRDYVFSFDRMMAFEGNTGPYLLYALARVRSMFRKAAERGVAHAAWNEAPIHVNHPAEKSLAIALIRYPAVVEQVARDLMPHRLCQYLFDLAQAFSSFYDACPVVGAEREETRLSRLAMCSLVDRVLEDGLRMLGIRTLERM